MDELENKYGIVIDSYDGIEYVIYENIGLALKHVEDYNIEFEDLTPEQLIWIWMEEVEKVDESKLDESHKEILREIKKETKKKKDDEEV